MARRILLKSVPYWNNRRPVQFSVTDTSSLSASLRHCSIAPSTLLSTRSMKAVRALAAMKPGKGIRVAVEEAVEDEDRLVCGDHLELTAERDADKVEQDADDAGADSHLADRLMHLNAGQP